MFSLQINTATEAFMDDRTMQRDLRAEGQEIERILKNVIGKIEDGCTYGTIYDRCGERVGRWQR